MSSNAKNNSDKAWREQNIEFDPGQMVSRGNVAVIQPSGMQTFNKLPQIVQGNVGTFYQQSAGNAVLGRELCTTAGTPMTKSYYKCNPKFNYTSTPKVTSALSHATSQHNHNRNMYADMAKFSPIRSISSENPSGSRNSSIKVPLQITQQQIINLGLTAGKSNGQMVFNNLNLDTDKAPKEPKQSVTSITSVSTQSSGTQTIEFALNRNNNKNSNSDIANFLKPNDHEKPIKREIYNEVIVVEEADSTTKNPENIFQTKNHVPNNEELINTNNDNESNPASPHDSIISDDVIFVSEEIAVIENNAEQKAEEQQLEITPPPSEVSEDNKFAFFRNVQGQFILGTVIEKKNGQCFVQFADGSETWCSEDQLRKFDDYLPESPEKSGICTACKTQKKEDILEICKRCGRGYHHTCTTETAPGSKLYICIRCEKPMNQTEINTNENTKRKSICRNFLYEVEKLNWDQHHRINTENVYCYCGRTGNFVHNMLQCCKCKNWFHTECIEDFEYELLPGDYFFVFCCTVCNDGEQFLRRLQITWIDALQLALFNCMLDSKNRKYFNFTKDIRPFLLRHRHQMSICKEWLSMKEEKFAASAKSALDNNSKIFVRQSKRPNMYALSASDPPLLPHLNFESNEILSNELLKKKFKLKIMPSAKRDNINNNDFEEASEEEVPIQQIIETIKKRKISTELTPPAAKRNRIGPVKDIEENSCARKSYKVAPVKFYATKNKNNTVARLTTSPSKDGPILDRLIPPLKSYNGKNNPFLLPSPERTDKTKSTRGKMVRIVKRRLNENDIKGGKPKNMRFRRSRSVRRDDVEVISTMTIGQYPHFQKTANFNGNSPASVPWISPRRRAVNQHICAQRQKSISAVSNKFAGNVANLVTNDNDKQDVKTSPPNNLERNCTLTFSDDAKEIGEIETEIEQGKVTKILMERKLSNGKLEYLVEWG